MGGLVFAGVNGAPTEQGNQPAVKAAPRVGAVFSFNDKTVLRGGWGLYYSPWNYAGGRHDRLGPDRLLRDDRCSAAGRRRADDHDDNPFPNGLDAAERQLARPAHRRRRRHPFVDPNKGAPRVQQVPGRPAARAAGRRERHAWATPA